MLLYTAQIKGGAPRRRGPALIADIDVTGATAKFQSQVFRVARFCVGREGEGEDAEDTELDPVQAMFR